MKRLFAWLRGLAVRRRKHPHSEWHGPNEYDGLP